MRSFYSHIYATLVHAQKVDSEEWEWAIQETTITYTISICISLHTHICECFMTTYLTQQNITDYTLFTCKNL